MKDAAQDSLKALFSLSLRFHEKKLASPARWNISEQTGMPWLCLYWFTDQFVWILADFYRTSF